MSKTFTLKPIFSDEKITELVQKYGLKRMTHNNLKDQLHTIFEEYIINALSELGDTVEARNAVYNEAIWYLTKAQKHLAGQPHPAGKMALKLKDMSATLNTIIQSNETNGADRAKRFVEKNLVRKLRQLWQANTAQPFTGDIYFDGHSPIEFILDCFACAGASFPEIEWFDQVDPITASKLIRSTR